MPHDEGLIFKGYTYFTCTDLVWLDQVGNRPTTSIEVNYIYHLILKFIILQLIDLDLDICTWKNKYIFQSGKLLYIGGSCINFKDWETCYI